MHRIVLAGCAASLLLATGSPAAQVASPAEARAVISRLPLRFEANRGQFDSTVLYGARTSTYSIALKEHSVALQFSGAPAVTLSMPGSRTTSQWEPMEREAVVTDYMVGSRDRWHAGVASFAKVRNRGIYPGIDMVFYGSENRLEYDFVLQAGADPSAIRLRFDGAGPLAITADGDLTLATPQGLITQRKPVIYQTDPRTGVRHAISGKYVRVADDVAAVQLGAYDHARPVVIDPVLSFSTLIGGSGTDTVVVVKYKNGLLYIGGTTQTGTLTTTDMPFNSSGDCFVEIINMNASGGPAIKYFTYLGGSSADIAYGMDIDAAGFVFLVGETSSADFPVQGGAVQTTGAASNGDGFLSKIDPNQAGTGHSLVYSTFLGGTIGDDLARSVAVDDKGVAYILGTTESPDFPVSDNAYATSLYGESDCFLAQIDTINGILLYSSFFGSEVGDDGRVVALAPNGLVYFVATTSGTQFPLAGQAFNGFPIGDYDIIIGAFDLTKSGTDTLVYGTYFGGTQNDEVRGMALDAQGRVILTGYTLSPDFPVTARTAVQSTYSGNGDAFVSVVDLTQGPGSFLVYSTFLGGSDGDVGYGVASDAGGYLYVTGYTLSSDFPVDANPIQQHWGGGVDMFITRINPAKSGLAAIDYSTYIGLDTTIVGCCLSLGPDGSLYVGGVTHQYLPLVSDTIQFAYGGGYTDGFLLVVSPAPGATSSAVPTRHHPDTPRNLPDKSGATTALRPRAIRQ